ncbi:MAG TPA: glutathione synthase [Methylophilaceae bacterium]|jgi:glutathione synthase|nr:glutathione synthase [Methylophilaceae bacterium]
MKFAFILDPLESLKIVKDTSLAIMREAAARGHTLFVAEQDDLILRNGTALLQAAEFQFSEGQEWFSLDAKTLHTPTDFDAVLMRKDPPFDTEYIYSTYLLELAENQGARVLNRPRSIRDWNEKLSVARFPQFAPPFLVTRHIAAIRQFLEDEGDIVVKPLDGMGGSGVFRLHRQDHNIGVILETITHYERRTVMAQRYLPEIKAGDKRILIIDGEPLPYALARIPKAGETRGNLAAGGKGVAQPLSARDREIATAVGIELKKEGLFLVGLDVIGDHLTEINVTSPTGMVEIAAQTDCNPAALFVDALERLG